jgi:aspartate aminotransferase/aminotransferase
MADYESWLADRTHQFESSGIRRVFDLAAKIKNPINLSIGQPDFDVPPPIKEALIQAIRDGKNGYSPTQGVQPLLKKLQASIDQEFGQSNRQVFVCGGTSGGLLLSMLALVNPGDEVIYFDPYFVMYPAMIAMVHGKSVKVSLYPDFKVDIDKLERAITPRTKAIIFNSPSNPPGVCASEEEIKAVADLAAKHGICLISDEIYSRFTYDQPHVSPAKYNPDSIVIDGFSKTYAMTGLRIGYVHAPSQLAETMLKIQQYTFVCAPQPAQWAGLVALDLDVTAYVDRYRSKRDRLLEGLQPHYEIATPGGAFYAFPKLPWGTGDEFVRAAIDRELLIIPGNIFSDHDTHFRISYAVDDATLERGITVLQQLAASRLANRA